MNTARTGEILGARITRDSVAAGGESYDLIVVGGGIYGAMLALESARRGLHPLLLERDDFGGATSWNSHRIVHGGLRYLQSLDFKRFAESVRERSWFLRHFPELVQPLSCLMPLYGQGARRPSVLRAALLANHLLSRNRNDGLRPDRVLEPGGVMTRRETISLFPDVRQKRLCGGALWYDAVMTDSQRLLIEVLRWACANGATCLNYVEATDLRTGSEGVTGVEAVDRTTGSELTFNAPLVINCAGPWCREVAACFDRDLERLFQPSLAFNILFDRQPASEAALAISAPGTGTHTWFLYGRGGRIYVGTGHHPWDGDSADLQPRHDQVDEMIESINAAAPKLDLRRHQILRIYAGLLPVTAARSTDLVTEPLIHEHGKHGGPAGLYSVSGVKYTTSRDVAERTLRAALGDTLAEPDPEMTQRPTPASVPRLDDVRRLAESSGHEAVRERLAELAKEEAVVQADDLLLRRTSWGEDPEIAAALSPTIEELLPETSRLR